MGKRRDDRDRDRPAPEFEETVVKVNRCATVVKGGRRFSFSALVALGNGGGKVGIGYGKANEVPSAIQKAIKDAKKSLVEVEIINETIPHEVLGRFGSAKVKLIPASAGTGVIAGPCVRALVEKAGIRNILTKSIGNNNPINLLKATLDGLMKIRSKESVEKLRGVKL